MSTLILLVFFLAFYIWEVIVELLNLSAIRSDIPKEFKGVYDEKKYKKSQEYLKETSIFSLIESGISLLLLILFILIGGFDSVDNFARSISSNEIGRGLIFAGILILLNQIVSLPFDIYKTFVIEQKFGFNKTTPKVFAIDIAKSMLLMAILGGGIFAALMLFFGAFGSSAWLIAWPFVTAVQLILYFVAPVIFLPMFNKFTPLADGKLKQAIEDFAKKQNFKLSGIFTMDGSKRSTKANAFFTGIGKFRRIALFDTLIKNHTTEELVSVLAHEIGHYKKKHILQHLIIGILTTGTMLFIISLLINNPDLFGAFGISQTSIYASFIISALVVTPLFSFIEIFRNFLSRKNEYEADQFAVETYGKKAAFLSALKKLSKSHLANLTPHPLKVLMEYSHPPILERIRHIRAL